VTLQNVLAAIERSAPPDYGFQVARYRTRIHERYGYLKFDSFHVTGADVRRIALRQVFVAPDAKEDLPPLDLPEEELLRMVEEGEMDAQEVQATAGGRDHEECKRRYQESPTRGVKELLGEARRAVVIGDPGSGKSSLLQEILLDWADQPDAKPFPLMVELRQCAMEKADWRGDFCKYFEVAADSLFKFNATELESYIRENPSVLLVDGLDEVFDPNERKRLTERVLNFAARFEKASVVVTSRKYGFQKDAWVNAAFRLFTLQDFTAPQSIEFLRQKPAEIVPFMPRLKEAIAGYTPVRMLAGNPLLLTMMAVINRMEPVPRRARWALYERCADLLVHWWEVTLGRMSGPGDPEVQGALRAPLDLGDKKTRLERVAHEMQNTAGDLMAEERLKGLVAGFLQENCFDDCAGTGAGDVEQLRGRNFILCSVGGRDTRLCTGRSWSSSRRGTMRGTWRGRR
jgi:predicted NACHT family NTPase